MAEQIVELRPCNLRQADIAEVARRIRAQFVDRFGFKSAADIFDVVQELGGTVVYDDPYAGSNGHGSIEVAGPRKMTIYLPAHTSGLRDRFTVAHELGHYFLHSRQGKEPGYCARSLENVRLEWEANWFAAELLMPEAEFRAAWAECGGQVDRLAQRFGVSPAAAGTRARALGIG